MILLKNATLLDQQQVDILIEEGRVTKIGMQLNAAHAEVIDLQGKYVVPGFVDVHVHWREPGFSYKETIKGGSLAAAKGGFTTAMLMPNVNPVPDTAEHLKQQLDIIANDSIIRAIPYAAISQNLEGTALSEMDELSQLGCFAFTDDGKGIQTSRLMYEAMQQAAKLNKAVVAHCEDNSLIYGGHMHQGKRSEELGIQGIPSICESVQIARDVLLAEAANCHYHVCHVSTKESVRVIRDAKRAGIKVTAEVCPHHLIYDDQQIPYDNGLWKMNPPLRDATDKQALIEALEDGTIDFIATDHAPHAMSEKDVPMSQASFGIVGSEIAFAQLYSHFVVTKRWTLKQLVEWLSIKPAQCFGLPYGQLAINSIADLTVLDLEKRQLVTEDIFASQGKNSPFVGQMLSGWPVLTLSEGRIVYRDL